MTYIYTPGLTADRGALPLACEPGIFGEDRFVLLTNGIIVMMTEEELRKASAGGLSS
jgi:hypothetical protein